MESIAQAPVRKASKVGAHIHSHSGEFAPRLDDVVIPGRGLSFQFTRSYRSTRSTEMGPLGRGWTFTYAKRIEWDDHDIVYFDGVGRKHRFTRGENGNFVSPDGFYSVLNLEDGQFVLRKQYGTKFVFETPESGGRLRTITDRNGNTLTLEHSDSTLLVTDPLERQMEITYDQDRIVEVRDHSDRVWEYKYDDNDCLTEVVLPPTEEFPDGPRVKHEYDEDLRLNAITDPKGQTFLRNSYDDQERVSEQQHGNGTYTFEYETIGQSARGFPVYRTTVHQKNDARLVLDHDEDGHVIKRIKFVSVDSLSPEYGGGTTDDMIGLTTASEFNHRGELIWRKFPKGNEVEWTFDEDHEDPRARGNLLKVTSTPAPDVESDQNEITVELSYDGDFQRPTSITNPKGETVRLEYDDRGNLTRRIYPEVTVRKVDSEPANRGTETRQLVEQFKYNAAGQLIETVDARGAVTKYLYYPESDPHGARGRDGLHNDQDKRGGYLGRVHGDPNPQPALPWDPADQKTDFAYDEVGNTTTFWDGKDNPLRFEYNSHNMVTRAVSRAPFEYEFTTRYDANMNPVEARASFDHNVYHGQTNRVESRTSTLIQRWEYNELNHLVRQVTEVGDRTIEERFELDANENIVRKVQPLGNATEYVFDERNLLQERRLGAGTEDETTTAYTYTANGRRATRTNGRGDPIRYEYDGFGRYRGFTNPGGTSKRQWWDAAGNITRVQVTGDPGAVDEQGQPVPSDPVVLMENWYEYDEMNRRVRADRAWRDQSAGEPLGNSNWDGREGRVSTVIEYGDNNLPAAAWYESNNVLRFAYDGANRIVSMQDASGESASFEYDENSNPVRIERTGRDVDGEDERFHQLIHQDFDEMDRLVSRSVNHEPPVQFTYNALNMVTRTTNPAEVATHFLHDGFGRSRGKATTVTTPDDDQEPKLHVQRMERDDNGRITARVDAGGERTEYQHDALNRRTGILYPDGAVKRFQYDENSNLTRIEAQNGDVIDQEFDALNRVVGREIQPDQGRTSTEEYHYDGLNRLVSAQANGLSVVRRFDTLSRLLEENQAGRTLQYEYNAAGNQTHVVYPSGRDVHKRHDTLGRVTEVQEGDSNSPLTSYSYRSSGQLLRQQIGDDVEASFTYRPCQGCLSEIAYRSTEDDSIIEGTRYRFDDADNRTAEIQLHRDDDDDFGERYRYDSRNRLVGAQYGVEDISDQDSDFEREVRRELDAMGSLQRRQVLTDEDEIELDIQGETTPRHGLQSLGDHSFQYDPNGNRVSEENGQGERRRFTYDYANRPVEVEELDAQDNVTRTVELDYDAFSRQLRKRVTDHTDGNDTQEREWIWNGSNLIEEWEEDAPDSSYIYGGGDAPVQMVDSDDQEFFYAYNGRGLVTALLDDDGQPTERYRYSVSGQPFDAEDEIPAGPFDADGSPSREGNRFYGGMWDDDVGGVLNGSNLGRFYDPHTNQHTNPEAGGGEVGCNNRYGGGNPAAKDGVLRSIGKFFAKAGKTAGKFAKKSATSPFSNGFRAFMQASKRNTAEAYPCELEGPCACPGTCSDDSSADNDEDAGPHTGGQGGQCGGGGSSKSQPGILYDPNRLARGEGRDPEGGNGPGDGDGDGSGGEGSGGEEGGGEEGGNGEGGSEGGNDGDEGDEGESGSAGCGGSDGGGGKAGVAGTQPGPRGGGGLADGPEMPDAAQQQTGSDGGGGSSSDPLGNGCSGRDSGPGSDSSGGCGGGNHTPNDQTANIGKAGGTGCRSGPGGVPNGHQTMPGNGKPNLIHSGISMCGEMAGFFEEVVQPDPSMGNLGKMANGSMSLKASCLPSGSYEGQGGTGRGDDFDCRVASTQNECGSEYRNASPEVDPSTCGRGSGGKPTELGNYLAEGIDHQEAKTGSKLDPKCRTV